jgi:hypothetical protein
VRAPSLSASGYIALAYGPPPGSLRSPPSPFQGESWIRRHYPPFCTAMPFLPVKPWQMTLVFLSIRIGIGQRLVSILRIKVR